MEEGARRQDSCSFEAAVLLEASLLWFGGLEKKRPKIFALAHNL